MTPEKHTFAKRLLGKAMACGFTLAVIASFFPFAAACETLPQDVVRLHVVANSDSEEDQAVKLLVRDAVLEEAARWYRRAAEQDYATAQCNLGWCCEAGKGVEQSWEEAARRPQVQYLQKCGALHAAVLLKGRTAPGQLKEVRFS